jgi:hypothetical protein
MEQVIGKASKGRTSVPTLVSVLMLIMVLTSLICLGYPSDSAYAAGFSEAPEVKLIASDGAADDRIGCSVAISGDTAVVGAYGDDIGANSTNQGSAYVFTRSGTNWMEEAKLTASDGEAGDILGISVAIDGDTVVVSAPWNDVGGNTDQGSAYVFTRSGTNWMEQAKLTASDGAEGDRFGISVAIDGDTAVVGVPWDHVGNNSYQGSAYVFTRSGSSWTEQAHLTASDGAPHDSFGTSVAIDGDTAVVGAHTDTVGGNPLYQGSAYVFTRSGGSWTEQAHLTASDGAADDGFGGSVAINGDTAVVGAYLDDVGANSTDQGSAHVFTRSGTIWGAQAKLTASDGAEGDRFGISVAINGDTAVVGAYLDDVGANSTDQGSAYVFTRSGTNWMEQAKLTASDGAAEDDFGISAAIDGDTVVVGAFYDDLEANGHIVSPNQGSAYVYEEGIAQVSATVTLEPYLISVRIAEGYPTAVDYGAMLPNTETEPTAYIPDTYSYLRVENDGNVAADLLIRGANATCETGTWILAATPGPDQYSHLYGLGQTPGSYSPLSTLTSVLGTNVTVGGTVDFNVKIQTPTNSTVYGQYSTTVTVLAVAS